MQRDYEVRVRGTDLGCHWYLIDAEGALYLWNAESFPGKHLAIADFEATKRRWQAQTGPVAFQRSKI